MLPWQPWPLPQPNLPLPYHPLHWQFPLLHCTGNPFILHKTTALTSSTPSLPQHGFSLFTLTLIYVFTIPTSSLYWQTLHSSPNPTMLPWQPWPYPNTAKNDSPSPYSCFGNAITHYIGNPFTFHPIYNLSLTPTWLLLVHTHPIHSFGN